MLKIVYDIKPVHSPGLAWAGWAGSELIDLETKQKVVHFACSEKVVHLGNQPETKLELELP